MAQEIQNSSYDSEVDNTIFITQEPGKNVPKEVQEPQFNLDIESFMDTSNDSGKIRVGSLDKYLDEGHALLGVGNLLEEESAKENPSV